MKKIIAGIALAVLVGAGVYLARDFLFRGDGSGKESVAAVISSGATEEAIAEISQYKYTKSYVHATDGFSFSYPEDFTITNVPNDDGSKAILVQNFSKKVGVQILISPFRGEDIDITPEVVVEEIPDLKISDAQELLVGANRKGLAFLSDNDAFGGKSREVWFVFRGNLYQISTYADLDAFLKGLFTTWQFN